MQVRELTGRERQLIRRLVKGMCANYDDEYGCLPLDGNCYMMGKWYTGSYCKYFVNALLPTCPQLMASLVEKEVKACKLCGSKFIRNGRQTYCSTKCERAGRRKDTAARTKRYRQNKKGSDELR